MYTDEQYSRAKALLDDPGTEAKYGPDGMGKLASKIAEYEGAHAPLPAPSEDHGFEQEPSIADFQDVQPRPEFDENLPNASKRKKYSAPPEYVSKTHSPLGVIAKNTLLDPLAGPSSTMHFEPSEKQFQADMGPYLQAKGVQPGDKAYLEAYADYKDSKWEQAYQAAAAEDRPLTRHEYVRGSSAWDKLSSALGQSGDVAAAFTQGYVNGLAPGASQAASGAQDALTGGDEVSADRERAARNPVASGLGEFMGSINPRSVPNKVAGLVGRIATPIAGRFGGAALAGAAGADSQILGNTGGQAIADQLHGRPIDQDTKSHFTARLLGGSLLGAGAGVFGEGIATAAQKYRSAIRGTTSDIGPELTNAEASGTATDALRGLEPSSDVRALLERARGPVPGEAKLAPTGTAVEYAAGKVRNPIVAQQELEHAAALKRMQESSGAMYARDPQLKVGKGMHATGETLLKTVLDRSQPEAAGKFLPGADEALGATNNAPFIDFVRKLYKPRLVAGVDAAREAARNGGRVVTLEEAQRAGFKVKGLENEVNPETGLPHNAPSLSGYSNVSESELLPNTAPRPEQTTRIDYDEPAAAVGGFAAAHPDLPLVQRYLNETRQANGLAERAGMHRETSAAMNGFVRDAEAAGHAYNGTVYRGATPSELERVLQGGVTPSTWSASKSVEGAMPFAKKGGVLFEIEGGAVPTDGIPGSNTFEEALVPHGAPMKVVGRRNEGGIEIVTLRRGGLTVEEAGGATRPEIDPGAAPSAPPAKLDVEVPDGYPAKEFRVILEPRPYDAMKMEEQIHAIDRAGKAGKKAEPDPAWNELMRAARIDREQFGKAWSGLKNLHHEELTALEQRAAHAGIAERNLYPEMSGNAQKTANSAITNYGVAPQATNEALGELADNAGVRGGLETLKGTRAYTALKEKASPKANEGITGGGGFLRVGGFGPALKLRADALARGVARGPDGLPLFVAPGSAAGNPALANEPLGRSLLPSSGLLAMGRGALGVKTGSVYDSATGRAKPAGTLTQEERARLEQLLAP